MLELRSALFRISKRLLNDGKSKLSYTIEFSVQKLTFFEQNPYSGVGAMEIVAMDLKLRGMYVARQLSFQGVTFKVEKVPLTEDFIQMYDESVELVSESVKLYKLNGVVWLS